MTSFSEKVLHWFPSNNCYHSNISAIKQVDCLAIQSESREGILVGGSKSTPENMP